MKSKNWQSHSFDILFSEFAVKLKRIVLALCMHLFHIWKSFGSLVMNQNALSQSYCRFLTSATSQEDIDEST